MTGVGEFVRRSTSIAGVFELVPTTYADRRGTFVRGFCEDAIERAGVPFDGIAQVNHSQSRKGTIRGLHFRASREENRLVAVLGGSAFDVIVDLRPGSPSYLECHATMLHADDPRMVVAPPGCAHGFQAVSEEALVIYFVDRPYAPHLDRVVRWDDPDLAIEWPILDPLLSDRDASAPHVSVIAPDLVRWFGS